jgi:methyl-accepting chemotaxis protein
MFRKLKISARLAVGFGIVLIAFFVVCALSVNSIKDAIALSHVTAERNAKTSALSTAQSAVWSLRWDVAQFIAVNDAADRKVIIDRAGDTRKQFENAMSIYEKMQWGDLTKEEIALSGELNSAFRRYSDARLKWFDLYGAGKTEEAVAFRAQTLTVAGGQTTSALGKLMQLQQNLVETSERTAVAELNRSMALLLSVGVLTLLTVAGIAWLLSRSITRPLARALTSVEFVAAGDLSHEIEKGLFRNEFGQLLNSLISMQQNLRSLVGDVAAGAHTVSDSSAQIAQGNLDLSQRTEEQASTLEETASSMEELTSTVTQNAENARQASQLAVSASDVARKGGQVVGQVVTTMNGISESSHKIADIIGVIDGIAFQTNILALNAAVEAARAGEQGRGFAVVAAEVRNLAQRSAAAAKEIKTLIGDSVDKVQAGTKLVDAAGKTMEEIVGSVEKVSDLIAEIAAASQEQSSGIGQVNTAITQMEQVVQQNASLVEEATAATESMKEQAAALLQLVSRFKLGRSEGEVATTVQLATPRAAARRAAAPQKPALAPIKVGSDQSRLTSGFGALEAPQRHPGNGAWQEF